LRSTFPFGRAFAAAKDALLPIPIIDAIIKGPLNGTVSQANNFLSPKLWFYKDEPLTVTFDLAKAKSMLDGIGYAPGADGVRAKNGKKLQVEICTTTRQYRIDSITLLASQLKALGVLGTPKSKPATPDVFGSWNDVPADTDCNVEHGNYDIAMHGNTSSPDPTSFAALFKSGPNGDPDSPTHPPASNEMRWFLPEMDAAWATIETSLDPAAIKDCDGQGARHHRVRPEHGLSAALQPQERVAGGRQCSQRGRRPIRGRPGLEHRGLVALPVIGAMI